MCDPHTIYPAGLLRAFERDKFGIFRGFCATLLILPVAALRLLHIDCSKGFSRRRVGVFAHILQHIGRVQMARGLGFTRTLVVYLSAVGSMLAGASAVHAILLPNMSIPNVRQAAHTPKRTTTSTTQQDP